MGKKRPIKSADEFEMLTDLYAAQQAEKGEILTLPGLALFMGLYGKEAIYEYQRTDDEWGLAVKKARSMIEDQHIRGTGGNATARDIFMLKNMGYSDKQEIKLDPVNITITGKDAEL